MKSCYFSIVLLFVLTFFSISSKAQTKYFIIFSDKNSQDFTPEKFFSPEAIERRQQQHIAWDKTDLPVNPAYVKAVSVLADSITVVSRWLNGVVTYLSSPFQEKQIRDMPFVQRLIPMLSTHPTLAARESDEDTGKIDKNLLLLLTKQTARFGSDYFEQAGADGKGIRIAVFDGGFPGVDVHPAFQHLRENKQIIATYDFIKNRENVYYGNQHGRMTLACIGGKYKGVKIGLATGAEFLLAKTEIGREPYSEEEHWLAAAEWADQMGANIISSSLGYGLQRYFQSDMDGKTSLVVKAAEMAARKGILVVNSAGNEGNNRWKGIITPSDGDSVLCVGGINPATDYRIKFTSRGPSADKRLKPNVSAYGHVVSASKEGLTTVDGTSFSCPLVAGFAACAWQLHPEFNNMDLFHELEHAGHLFPYFDYIHGYGIPQAKHFAEKNTSAPLPTFKFVDKGDKIEIEVFPGISNNTDWLQDQNLLYYHVQNQDRWLRKYGLVRVDQKKAMVIPKAGFDDLSFRPGDVLRVHFRGYTETYLLN